MPYNWNPTSERQMLLLAITKANLRPTSETWAAVASLLGNGLTPSAVSQKFYKLRNESAATNRTPVSTPAQVTPTKRKRKSSVKSDKQEYDDNEDAVTVTPSMRVTADRPFKKLQRDDHNDQEDAIPGEISMKEEKTEDRTKSEIKGESFAHSECQSDSD